MSTPGVVESVEGDLPRASPADGSVAKERVIAAWTLDGIRHHIRDLIDEFKVLMGTEMEARRGDLEGRLDRLRKLEGDIGREAPPGVRITNRRTGGKGPAWLIKMVMGVCIILVAQGIIATITVVVTVASLKTEFHDYIKSNDKRMDTDEQQIRDTQRRLDRGAATM